MSNQWEQDLCSCCDSEESGCAAFCCPCCLFGQNAAKVTGSSCWWFCLGWFLVPFSYCCCCHVRTKLRTALGIEGSECGDCCTHICCHPCALSQEAVELKDLQEKIQRMAAAQAAMLGAGQAPLPAGFQGQGQMPGPNFRGQGRGGYGTQGQRQGVNQVIHGGINNQVISNQPGAARGTGTMATGEAERVQVLARRQVLPRVVVQDDCLRLVAEEVVQVAAVHDDGEGGGRVAVREIRRVHQI